MDNFGNGTNYYRIVNSASGISMSGNKFTVTFFDAVLVDKANFKAIIVIPDLTDFTTAYILLPNGSKVFAAESLNTFIGSDKIALIPHTIGGRNGAAASNGQFIFSGFAAYDKALTDNEARECLENDGQLDIAELAEFISGDLGSKIRGNTYTPLNVVSAFPVIENKTLLPELKQSLLHETGISIGESYTSIVGMGFTIKLLADIAALSEIITGLPAITKFTFNGVVLVNEAALIVAININELCHIDIEWS